MKSLRVGVTIYCSEPLVVKQLFPEKSLPKPVTKKSLADQCAKLQHAAVVYRCHGVRQGVHKMEKGRVVNWGTPLPKKAQTNKSG